MDEQFLTNPTVLAWLFDAGTILATALLIGSLAYGLGLLIVPTAMLHIAQKLDRRFSGRRAMRPLEIPRVTEKFFYRHHRLVGVLLLIGIAAFFFVYFVKFPRDTVLARLSREIGAPLAGTLVDSASTFLLAANALIGLLGLVMIFRPSLLKPFESLANRWLSTRRALRGAETVHDPLDRFTVRHPRLVGALVVGSVGYILGSLFVAIV